LMSSSPELDALASAARHLCIVVVLKLAHPLAPLGYLRK